MNFIVKDQNIGQRLDIFLTKNLNQLSRSQIKKMVEGGLVLVDQKPAKPHQFLKAGQKIIIIPAEEKIKQIQRATPNFYYRPKVIFENNDFLVLEKPAGMLVHPTEKNEPDTLVDWLLKKYPQVKNVGEEQNRDGIIHRLDKEVSGIMIVAKTNKAYYYLKEQFKKRLVKKEYITLVYGKIHDQTGEIDLPIGRNKEGIFVAHPRQGKEKLHYQDKVAKTQYQVLKYLKDYTLLRIRILTGRTHQIRVHLSAIGHPILGDQIYKPKKKFFHFLRKKIKVVDPGRIFLHSVKIGFYDLNKQWVEFSSPLPKSLEDFLDETKK
jgi:23S rRNA pseudouridine1911/1915/1917 synthase